MGDFQANFARPVSDLHTVEGNVAGSRAAGLEKKRAAEQEEFERAKKKLHQENKASQQKLTTKFASQVQESAASSSFTAATVGLVTAEQFRELSKQQQQDTDAATSQTTNNRNEEAAQDFKKREKAERKARKKKLREKKKQLATLSFAGEEEELEEEEEETTTNTSSSKTKKDPTIDTSFLPDAQRDQREREERQHYEQQWKQEQAAQKQQQLEITYSYWDGSGHRRSVTLTKGSTIGDFLERVRCELKSEFRELAANHADDLLYVKEDVIVPHDLTFYDLIATKARGISGPLFHFDVHDDVRVGTAIDVRIEKDESHPGKVVQRHWYERHKHIFPASRWQVYDPTKDYGTYTISGNASGGGGGGSKK